MRIETETLEQVVTEVLATMTGVVASPVCDARASTVRRSVAACIHLTGAYTGAVVITMPEELGRRIAASMFAADPSALSDGEVMDAVGEIANMVAGSVRSALPMPNAISLPSVSEGTGLRMDVPGSVAVATTAFVVDGDIFDVVLSARAGEA
jgi:chemotaxis protein CheX